MKRLLPLVVLGLTACSAASHPPLPDELKYTWYPSTDRTASADELAVLAYTNAARAAGQTCGQTPYPPAPTLVWSDRLAHAARNHAQDMAARQYFGHVTPEGVTGAQRMTLAGYRWQYAGENLAAGQDTAAQVVARWLASEGHCRNLMNPNFTELGVGAVAHADRYGRYHVQNFGQPAR